ncbi:Nucleoid occlusion protein [subsurface metagenome]
MSKIIYINLSDLTMPEFEAHKQIPDDYIAEITQSIKDIGIIEPLIVRKKEKSYEIIVGCIRYRCAKIAGLKSVPAIILSLDDKAAEVMKIHENIKRIPLDHVDQGNTFVMMRDKFLMTENDISAIVGKSIAYISQHISLVSHDEELIRAVREKMISFSQARELMKVDDKVERRRLLLFCQNEGATVEVLKTWIKDYKNSKLLESPVSDSGDSTPYHQDRVQDWRTCQACGKATNISDIRQLFLCPPCESALKKAFSEEKSDISQNNKHP